MLIISALISLLIHSLRFLYPDSGSTNNFLLVEQYFSRNGIDFLVMTSANLSSEPICSKKDEIISGLQPIIDYILDYDRDIVMKLDDSVVMGFYRRGRRRRFSGPRKAPLITTN